MAKNNNNNFITIEVAEQALQHIRPDDRDTWVTMAMAIKSEFGEAGFDLWDRWSQGADSYRERDARDVWKSIKPGGKVTIGTLIHAAQAAGFTFEQPELTEEQKAEQQRELAARKKRREAEQKKQAEETADWHERIGALSRQIIAEHGKPSGSCQYLGKKRVRGHGVYFVRHGFIVYIDSLNHITNIITGQENIKLFFDAYDKGAFDAEEKSFLHIKRGTLMVPLADINGVVLNIQFVFSAGGKKFIKNGRKSGLFHIVGPLAEDTSQRAIVAEGYATAASLYQATGIPAVVAFDAGNIKPVCRHIKTLYPEKHIIVGGDDDTATPGNPGRTKATEAANFVHGVAVFPSFAEGEKGTDWNDLLCLTDASTVKTQFFAALVDHERDPGGDPHAHPGANPEPPAAGDVINANIDLNLDALLRDFVILHGKGGGVFDDRRCELMTKTDLSNSVGDETTKKFFNHPDRRVILRKNLVFEPDRLEQPPGKINLFRGLPMKPKKGECQRLLELLFMLCEENREVYDWLLKWVAFPLQHVGAKMRTAVVIHGKEGAGKNSFWTAIQRIYGEYSTIITQTDLESSFNAWASRKLFVVGNEVVSRKEMFHQAGVIRNMITEPEWNINDKNISVREEKNYANFVFLSNALQPAAPNEDDRRFLVLWTPPKKEKSYYTALAHERDNGGTEALYHHLLGIDLGEFDEYSEPPMTKAKQDLISLSMKSHERFTWLWLEGELNIPLIPVVSTDLYKFYEGWCKRTNQKFTAELTEFGVSLGKHELLEKKPDQEYRRGLGTRKATFIFPVGCAQPDGVTKADWLKTCRDEFWEAVRQLADDDV